MQKEKRLEAIDKLRESILLVDEGKDWRRLYEWFEENFELIQSKIDSEYYMALTENAYSNISLAFSELIDSVDYLSDLIDRGRA